MMKFSSLFSAVVLLAAVSAPALAADMRMPMKAAPPVAAPVAIWSGFYIGAMGGYAAEADDTVISGVSTRIRGGFAGGTIGYNWQAGQFVGGIEADGAWADINASATLLGITVEDRIRSLGTVRGRVGVAFDTVYLYGTGGYAWADNRISVTALGVTIADSNFHHGWTAGAGVEWMFAPKWSFKAEYLYRRFGSETYFAGIVPPGIASGSASFHSGQVGVNFHF
jgi:outer membrane immunogenic protein